MTASSSVLLPPGGQRILVVQAHPDDAEHICGGTIALLVAEGLENILIQTIRVYT
jgi:LmbE family N-acetylglucosaminyl deacetylase